MSTPTSTNGVAAPQTPRRGLVWILVLITAGLLAGTSTLFESIFPLIIPPKGSAAPYTLRARQDAAFDLHETYRAEAQEAKQAYVPIYNKDNELLYDYRKTILKAALAERAKTWPWPAIVPPRVDAAPAPADAAPTEAGGDAAPRIGSADAGMPPEVPAKVELEGPPTPAAGVPLALATRERQRELEAVVRGCFELLEPFYKAGVVGNNEYPAEKRRVRIFSRAKYVNRTVSELHRFSELRTALEKKATKYFFKTDPKVRDRIIDYILQRLPPNLTYAKENDKFIKDISQVTGMKLLLIRRGQVLAARGEVVDTRAFYAIQASALASAATSPTGQQLGRMGMLLALLFLLVVGAREICGPGFRSTKSYLVVFLGMVFIAVWGQLVLVYTPLPATVVPQAALALVIAVVLGRAPGLIVAIAVPCVMIATQVFDLTTLLVGTAGGVTGALVVRRRRRSSALLASVLVGVAQAVAFEATRVLEGRPQDWQELWSAGAAFGGGLASGVVALVALPFVEWLLGKSSRGKLKVLTDFDHPLVRELRERAPGTFAHTVTLINMVELATDAVGGDRLLARAGTLFHDVGKMAAPAYFIENQGQGPNIHDDLPPEESARAILAHVPDGQRIAKKHFLPPDVSAFIPEHHGTTGLEYFIARAREAGAEPDPSRFHYSGPKPQSIETAILMIADSVEAASKTLSDPTEEALWGLVDRIVFKKWSEVQFDECGLTQADLRKIKAAFVAYLKGALHRRVEYPSQRSEGDTSDTNDTSDESK
jgi:putative nucleotidyltransferase with HDIG domain